MEANHKVEDSAVDPPVNKVADVLDFIENATMPMHWVNGSGIIIWANQAELDLLGYTKEEYVNKHISNFHLDSDVIDVIMKRLVAKETLIDHAARLLCKDGSLKYVLINSNVLWRDGEFIHTRCFTKDITAIVKERESASESIRKLELEIARLKDQKKGK